MKYVYLLLSLSLILAACSSIPRIAPAPTDSFVRQTAPTTTSSPEQAEATPIGISESNGQPPTSTQDLVRTDDQGMVTVEVTPINLSDSGEVLEFEVGLNTHSVDLSMDLASLATLTTDSGKTVQASQWDAPRGGHHVSGKLIFPATVEGQPILNGAQKLTLTIKDLDAPERIFSWDLNS